MNRSRNSHGTAAYTVLSTVAVTCLVLLSIPAIVPAWQPVDDPVLRSARGLNPSSSATKNYNCALAQVDAYNNTVPPPASPRVYAFDCDKPGPETPPGSGTYPYKNQGSACVDCPTIGQSIKLNNDSIVSGYVGPVGSVNCGDAASMTQGVKGTCDANGKCTNTVRYACNTELKFYTMQSYAPQ